MRNKTDILTQLAILELVEKLGQVIKERDHYKTLYDALETVVEISEECGFIRFECYGKRTDEWAEAYNKYQSLKNNSNIFLNDDQLKKLCDIYGVPPEILHPDHK